MNDYFKKMPTYSQLDTIATDLQKGVWVGLKPMSNDSIFKIC